MTDGLVCDACGATLLADENVRYVVDMKGYAAYDPMEISPADLERDFEDEMSRLLAAMAERDPQALEEEVHREFRMDLCPRCWKAWCRDPLAGLRKAGRDGRPEDRPPSDPDEGPGLPPPGDAT